MTDRVQAYSQRSGSVPWIGSHSENTAAHADLDRRQPYRAATSPPPSSTRISTLITPCLGQVASHPAALYPGRRYPQTAHRPDIYFSPAMNCSPHDQIYPSCHPNGSPVTNATQLYPAHQQQFYGVPYNNNSARRPSSPSVPPPPPPPFPIPPKPLALQQESRQDSSRSSARVTMDRSYSSPPPVPPKPALLLEPEAAVIPTSAYLGKSLSVTAGATSTAATTIPPIAFPIPSHEVFGVEPPAEAGSSSSSSSLATQRLQRRAREGEEEEDGDDLAVALALSKDESMREEERIKELARLEEEEFERALAASMLTTGGGGGGGDYDFYGSQPEAGPSNWTPSAVAGPSSPPLATSLDLLQKTGSVASFDTARDIEAFSSSQASGLAGEAKPGVNGSQATQAVAPVPVYMNTPSPPLIKRRSLDGGLADGALSSNHDEAPPIYSSEVADQNQTPVSISFPSPDIPSRPEPTNPETPRDGGVDEDADKLPYLRGMQDRLSVTIPNSRLPANPQQRSSRLSPVSASFIDLSYDDSYIDEDEAFARRLAEEEEISQRLAAAEQRGVHQENQQNDQTSVECQTSCNTSITSGTHPDMSSDLPTYNDVISVSNIGQSRRSTFVPEVRVETPAGPAHDRPDLARNYSINSVASAPVPSTSSQNTAAFPSDGLNAVTLQHNEPQRIIGRVSSMSALPPSRPPPEDDLPMTPVDDLAVSLNHLSLNSKAIHLTASPTNGINGPNDVPSSSAGLLNANNFIDAELLHGVSIQFTPPVISAKLTPMQGQMPTLITLPYGRCPPLHFQAPSWRHMLKLMARLSNTKIEPSFEALAAYKNEVPKLRTVVQFIKPHHLSEEWRVILWFTIDHRNSQDAPNASKNSAINVNCLPFSYTLSSPPAVLKDASDGPLSKTYTIPATGSVPYPSLPITFPNLTLYLQAALDDSRQQNESSPLRKFAKMVETCYPNDLPIQDVDEPDKSSGVSGLFKKVIGRGGKRGKRGGGGNEDTYELVTPFVPDEWG